MASGETDIRIALDDAPFQRAVTRVQWRLQEWYWRDRAAATTAHADWYCALPWWKEWLAMVLAL